MVRHRARVGQASQKVSALGSRNPMVDAITQIPRAGVGVIVRKDGKVLLGKRVGKHGQDTWSFPGGLMEFGESFEESAIREIREEVGIELKNVHAGPYVNSVFKKEHRHSVVIYVIADWKSGVPKITEPDKVVDLGWYEWKKFPKPLFLPVIQLLKTSFNPFK